MRPAPIRPRVPLPRPFAVQFMGVENAIRAIARLGRRNRRVGLDRDEIQAGLAAARLTLAWLADIAAATSNEELHELLDRVSSQARALRADRGRGDRRAA